MLQPGVSNLYQRRQSKLHPEVTCAEKQAFTCALEFEMSGDSNPTQPSLLTGSLEKQNPDVRPVLTNLGMRHAIFVHQGPKLFF